MRCNGVQMQSADCAPGSSGASRTQKKRRPLGKRTSTLGWPRWPTTLEVRLASAAKRRVALRIARAPGEPGTSTLNAHAGSGSLWPVCTEKIPMHTPLDISFPQWHVRPHIQVGCIQHTGLPRHLGLGILPRRAPQLAPVEGPGAALLHVPEAPTHTPPPLYPVGSSVIVPHLASGLLPESDQDGQLL